MIGGVTRHMLPHLPGVPHLHVNRPLIYKGIGRKPHFTKLLGPVDTPHFAELNLMQMSENKKIILVETC